MQHCQVMNLILRIKKQGLSRISALLAVVLQNIDDYSTTEYTELANHISL